MTPNDSVHTAQARASLWAFLAEFRQRVRETRDADAALLSEGRRAINEGNALLRQVAIDHPNV